jgi:predicted aspartyl protease
VGHVHADLKVRWTKEAVLSALLVDTGATFTALPKEVLEDIGAAKLPGKVPVELGDGKVVEADAYAMRAGIGDREGIVFAVTFEGAKAVIGVQTLESLGLKVNPVTGELEATRPKGIAYFYKEEIG